MKLLLITGFPRSGVSITAGVFHACGALGGGFDTRVGWNRYENQIISRRIIPEALRLQFELPIIPRISPGRFQYLLEEVFRPESDKIYFIKDYRLIYIWRLIRDAFPEAVWILVDREFGSVVRSCFCTRYMRAYTTEDGWKGHFKDFSMYREQLKESNPPLQTVLPQKFLSGHFGDIVSTVQSVGLRWDNEKVLSLLGGTKRGTQSN